jgi:hypothetical protein
MKLWFKDFKTAVFELATEIAEIIVGEKFSI